jgi:mono/diheme cytochrome c family protein
MRRLAVLPPSILTAVLGVALLLLQFVPQAVAQGSEMMSGGCMGMNCMSGPGAGMMGGMGGSMLRHQEFMMDRIPEPYASMTNPLPNTAGVIARGRAVFEEGCASCHGLEGLGNGEAGRELSPPPANLAMLTRMPMMRNDRYLFWAISEGGVAFGTQMPAFRDTLSAEEIWSVVRFLQAGLPQAGETEAPK